MAQKQFFEAEVWQTAEQEAFGELRSYLTGSVARREIASIAHRAWMLDRSSARLILCASASH